MVYVGQDGPKKRFQTITPKKEQDIGIVDQGTWE